MPSDSSSVEERPAAEADEEEEGSRVDAVEETRRKERGGRPEKPSLSVGEVASCAAEEEYEEDDDDAPLR